jgi:hypothetical protein
VLERDPSAISRTSARRIWGGLRFATIADKGVWVCVVCKMLCPGVPKCGACRRRKVVGRAFPLERNAVVAALSNVDTSVSCVLCARPYSLGEELRERNEQVGEGAGYPVPALVVIYDRLSSSF